MTAPYVHESQVEYWTSRDIEDFLLDEGFQVTVLPLAALTLGVTADFIFDFLAGGGNLFGLQFKALHEDAEDHWSLDLQQHKQLQHLDWMYYGLSDITEPAQYRNALHYLCVVPPGVIACTPRITRPDLRRGRAGYKRWAAFFYDVRKCRAGLKVNNKEEFLEALWLPGAEDKIAQEVLEIASEVFFLEFGRKRSVRFSGVIR